MKDKETPLRLVRLWAKMGYPQKLVESSKAQREYNPCFVVETFLLFLVHSVVEKYVFE